MLTTKCVSDGASKYKDQITKFILLVGPACSASSFPSPPHAANVRFRHDALSARPPALSYLQIPAAACNVDNQGGRQKTNQLLPRYRCLARPVSIAPPHRPRPEPPARRLIRHNLQSKPHQLPATPRRARRRPHNARKSTPVVCSLQTLPREIASSVCPAPKVR